MNAKPLVIFGTGGQARELHALVEDINRVQPEHRVLGWLDGNPDQHGRSVHGLPVLGGLEWVTEHPNVAIALGLGAPAVRRRIANQLERAGHRNFATLIHPRAVVGSRVNIGQGSVICALASATTDCSVGRFTLLNVGSAITHDDILEDFVTISPGANISGNVTVGEGTDIGTNATIIQGVSVGRWSIVGAGAVVTRSLPDNVTAVGAPAKPIKAREDGWHL